MANSPVLCGGLVLSVMLGLTGCGTDRRFNPVIEDYVGGPFTGKETVGVMATTASHRTIIVRLNTTEDGAGKRGQVCPEPPPDVSQSIAAAVAGALSVPVGTSSDQMQESWRAAFASNFSTMVAPLLKRSQGLQFYRDGMYYLCVAYINDIITARMFKKTANLLHKAAHKLIMKEVEKPSHMLTVVVQNPDPAAAAQKVIEGVEEIQKKLDELNESDR